MFRYKSWNPAAVRPVATEEEAQPKENKITPLSRSVSLPFPSVAPPHTSSSRTIIPRRPHAGRDLLLNPYRPHVAAADRIRCWSTPFSLNSEAEIFRRLPPSLAKKTLNQIHGALAPNTKTSYGAGSVSRSGQVRSFALIRKRP
ncbi:hypothetical protein BD779DRAFT_1680020 [Infundibulicybe gibba]|nr:hypothetical protein BD779DRAFT_1680020 [Infundibulicybe gibba]